METTPTTLTRTTFATQPLPPATAAQVLAKLGELLLFLAEERLTTHPAIRGVTYQAECAQTALRAELLAARLAEATAARETT